MRLYKLIITALLGGCGGMLASYWCRVFSLGTLPTLAVGTVAGFSLAVGWCMWNADLLDTHEDWE